MNVVKMKNRLAGVVLAMGFLLVMGAAGAFDANPDAEILPVLGGAILGFVMVIGAGSYLRIFDNA